MRVRNRIYKKRRCSLKKTNWFSYKEQCNYVIVLERKPTKGVGSDAALDPSGWSADMFWYKVKPLLPSWKSENDSDFMQIIQDGKIMKEPCLIVNISQLSD